MYYWNIIVSQGVIFLLKRLFNCKHEKNNSDYFLAELEREKEWCKENTINFTPEILINGRSFPKEYNRSDLIFFIEELEENSQITISKV